MNRRRFLELLGSAALGSGIVYSFPSVIVPKNIASDDYIHLSIKITPEYMLRVIDDSEFGFGFLDFDRIRHFYVNSNGIFETDSSVITRLSQENLRSMHLLSNV